MPKRQPIEAWLEKPEPRSSPTCDTVIEMEPLSPRESELDIFVIHRRSKPIKSAANPDVDGPNRDMEIIGRVPSPSSSESSVTTLNLDFESGPAQPQENEGEQGNPSGGVLANADQNETRDQSRQGGHGWDEENRARRDEEQQRRIFWTRIYLLMTLKVMFYLGMTPGHPETQSNHGWGKRCVFMAIRIVILVLALLQSFAFFKLAFFWGMDDGILNYHVTLWYAVLNTIKRVVFWGTLWWYADDFMQLFQLLLEIFEKDNITENTKITKVIFVLMIGTSVGDAVISLFIPYILYEEDLGVLQYFSLKFSKFIFVWQTEYDSDSLLLEKYGTNVTAMTAAMATLEASIKTTGYLQENLINDVGLSISLTVLGLTSALKKMLMANEYGVNANHNYEHRAAIWNLHRQIRRACKLLNGVVGPFLLFLHADNLLFLAYYLFDSIIGEENPFVIVEQTVFLVKLTCFYAVAAKASEINPAFREWVTTKYCITDVVYVQDDVNVLAQAVVDGLTHDPIGVGSGMFLMTMEFFAKFYGGVGSCFLLVYDFAKDPLISAIA